MYSWFARIAGTEENLPRRSHGGFGKSDLFSKPPAHNGALGHNNDGTPRYFRSALRDPYGRFRKTHGRTFEESKARVNWGSEAFVDAGQRQVYVEGFQM